MLGIEFTRADGTADAATALAVQQATTKQGLLTLDLRPARQRRAPHPGTRRQ